MQQVENEDGYVLARTEAEYSRLKFQAAMWAPFTERVLKKAGLAPGMKVLDAGCGPCEVMRLMNRCVGPTGHVTGVDIDADVGAYGLAQLEREEKGNYAFHTSDLTAGDTIPGAPFDAIFCRFFLIHMDDPVQMVRHFAAMLKPGGTLIAMDYVLNTLQVAPDEPTIQKGIQLLLDVFEKTDRPTDCGVRLAEYFLNAGLPMPQGTDAESKLVVTGEQTSMFATVLESLKTPAENLGLYTEAELLQLTSEIRTIAARGEHCMLRPTVTAVWTKTTS